ncbi:Threonine/homoserine/homoserine lactone efflux protein [Amycolatopsis arida]|uniref:Threonine/homoserine/homoserine lactone efflux protein n=1 Tax=Amycolatopsis arida TaxID=587909 RepID=A0A1I5X051_9PSEU|nr:LysE family translocator [Amycolatopsis arida]TDX92531.1 threonine/homoserine/homoserine lactone efflux protein [Amycolatopsis arida]SFQ25196.1 Threonine/homoserine/homoserine lactone efflux protein [Amycolatopsis arida]
MDPGLLVAFLGAAAVISLAPGPDMMYIVANGMAAGPRAGVVAALGMSTGLAVHSLAAALGLSALFQAVPAALDVVRVAGVVFLLYLAVDALRSSGPDVPDVRRQPEMRSLRKVYGLAVLTNLANPKVIIFYLAFVPQFVTPGSAWPVPVQMLVLGALLIVVGLTVDALTGFTSGRLADLLARHRAVRRWLDRMSAAVFAGLAVRLAVDDPAR